MVTLLMVGVLLSGNLRLDEPILTGSPDYLLQYDDGTGWWVTWEGLYRGVWFNTVDFFGSAVMSSAEEGEFWFYHDSGYPWDTSSFYAELYNGDAAGPETELEETSVTATHNSAVLVDYESVPVLDEFWLFVNTEMSSGHWPSTLGDGTPNTKADHSLYSRDMIIWEPWVIQGPYANDYMIRMDAIFCDLETNTWGSIKTLF